MGASMRRKSKNRESRKRKYLEEIVEIELIESWIDFGRPDPGTNPLSISPLPPDAPIGKFNDGSFSRYPGCTMFSQLPVSQNTKNGLRLSKFTKMTDIQIASLPHSLCGRDILGAAKTGSGKTLAFILPVLEKLYRLRWGSEDGVGCIIISPTRELAGQTYDVLKSVGKYHNFNAGLLIGGCKDVDMEKNRVNELNIIICTPGRLLQHMDETPNFDCSELQILVLDEADRILDVGFKADLNAIISQLPKCRQTLLFSATQTKSVQDLARLSLSDPEYISVHEESVTATPIRLQQTAVVVPLDQKLDMLWSFIKSHINSTTLVFLSSCKQVKFVYETFKKLRPGIPLKCLHGRMKQEQRMGIYSEFCEKRSVLFSTDVASRGLDFNKAVNWVVQVDCPENVAAYIHRVGRTARYLSGGKSLLFIEPSEIKMMERLQASKIPVHLVKANVKRIMPVSGLLSALLVKYPELQQLAQRAFVTYLRSIHLQSDKEIFDISKLQIEEFSASLGLPMSPRIRFLKRKSDQIKGKSSISVKSPSKKSSVVKINEGSNDNVFLEVGENASLHLRNENHIEEKENRTLTRNSKKKKLKINVHKPVGTRVVFDEEGKTLTRFAAMAEVSSIHDSIHIDKVQERYAKMREEMKKADAQDKAHERKRLKDKQHRERPKPPEKWTEEGDDNREDGGRHQKKKKQKKQKLYFDSGDEEERGEVGHISLHDQEAIALKLLNSMHHS